VKRCKTCGETDVRQFWKNKNFPDGLSFYCKECSKKRHQKWYENNKEKVNVQTKKWREKNPEKARAIAAKSHKKHRKEKIERATEYRKTHRELIRIQQRKYVKNNKEKVLESKRKWNLAHPELAKAYHLANQRLREARKKKVTIGNREEIKRFYIYVHTSPYIECTYCKEPVPKGKRQVDHIIPLSRNGEHSLLNLAPSCMTCNLKKFNKTADEFRSDQDDTK